MRKYGKVIISLLATALLSSCSNVPSGSNSSSSNSSSSSSSYSSSESSSSSSSEDSSSRYNDIADYYKNLKYKNSDNLIINTYGEGGTHHNTFNVNNGKNYAYSAQYNNYDLYIPDSAKEQVNENHAVILFIHGGAWIAGSKDDTNSFAQQFVAKGYIVANMDYTLLSQSLGYEKLSIYHNMDEIDACIKSVKAKLDHLGFDTAKSKLAIGGVSAGAHLAMLYAYSRGSEAVLPLQFVIDGVGPVSLNSETWKKFKADEGGAISALGITPEAIATQEAANNITNLPLGTSTEWNQFTAMYNVDGMCGSPYTLEEIQATTTDNVHVDASNPVVQVLLNYGENSVSPTYFIKDNSFPIIMAYGGVDTIIGINQYATLKPCLTAHSIKSEFFYFSHSGHALDDSRDASVMSSFMDKIYEWVDASLI